MDDAATPIDEHRITEAHAFFGREVRRWIIEVGDEDEQPWPIRTQGGDYRRPAPLTALPDPVAPSSAQDPTLSVLSPLRPPTCGEPAEAGPPDAARAVTER
jgi:hypothetical protein